MAIVVKHREVVCSGADYLCRDFIKEQPEDERNQYKLFTEITSISPFESLRLDSIGAEGVKPSIRLSVTDNGTPEKHLWFCMDDMAKPQSKHQPYTPIEDADVVLDIVCVGRLIEHLQLWVKTPHYTIKQ